MVKRVSRKVASAMMATYTKERELPAARSTLEPVNVQVLLHHRDGVESAPVYYGNRHLLGVCSPRVYICGEVPISIVGKP